jgi:hypothetical protein
MDWGPFVGGLIGAGIPAILAYLGLRRGRQAADAEAFGPAVLLLYRVHPDRVLINLNPDGAKEQEKWADLQKQLDVARERLLIVSAGNPRRHARQLARSAEVKLSTVYQRSSWAVRDLQEHRDNPEWVKEARKAHAEAMAAMEDLIEANFGWHLFGRHPLKRLASAARRLGGRADTPKALGDAGGGEQSASQPGTTRQ